MICNITAKYTTLQMEKKRLCYISRNYYNLTGAGNKAKTDNEDTLRDMGAANLGLPRTVVDSKVVAFFLDLAGIVSACVRLRKGDVLFLQYPVKKYFAFLCRVARMKGACTVALIHDLGSFRRKKLTVEKEIARLSCSDYIIASNHNMRTWLMAHGLQKPVGALGLFDYRSPLFHQAPAAETAARKAPHVVYAGALSMRKNAFLVELTRRLSGWHLTIAGNKEGLHGLQPNPCVDYRGFIPSDEFISTIDADFGLVWDGDSLDTCSGEYGQYLKLNSPHKVSFNLRAGLPIIVWKEAAVAPIVEKEGCGICIASLHELDEILRTIKPEDVARMKKNAQSVAQKLNDGYFLKEALRAAESEGCEK